jgi:radical SAM superfamily enzyme YgiQ (UPF0313 family)
MILINASPKNALKIFQPFLPITIPMGLAYIYAVCLREGIKVRLIDEQIEENILGLVEQYVKEMDPPYIFGFGVLTATFQSAIKMSRQLKVLYPDSIIVFGGIHPSAMPEEVLSYKHVDIVVRGEGEKVIVDLYKTLMDKGDFTRLDNISYRLDNRFIHNKVSPHPVPLNELPAFPYYLFDDKRYDLGFVMSSRGCPYKCIFCSNRVTTGLKYRFRPNESVVDDIELLHDRYGKCFVGFYDDNFLVNKKRIYDLIDEIKKRGLDKKIKFGFQARADNTNYEILKKLYDSGFRTVFFGIETSSESLMKTIKKGETVEQCIEAVKTAKSIGYFVSATFIFGLPGETHEDRINCAKLSKELGIDMVRFNNATPYPGTELYKIAKKENELHIQGLYENFSTVSAFIENPFKKIPFSYTPKGSSEIEIRSDILLSYLIHYLNYEKIKGIFSKSNKNDWFEPGDNKMDFLKKLPALIMLFLLLTVKFSELFWNVIFKRNSISIRDFLTIVKKEKVIVPP